MPFSNQQLQSEGLPSISDITFEKLDPSYRKISVITSCIFCLVILIVYLFVGYFIDILYQWPWILVFALGWSVLTGLVIILATKGYDYEGFAIREKDILYQSGIFFKSVVIIPFNRVQHCEIEQGPVDRMFGLSSLSIFTAGGSSSDLNIPGLAHDQANQLKQFITNQVARDEEE
jgi:uncharacterized protein